MSTYEEMIPTGVHLVPPNYVEKSVTVGDGVTAPATTYSLAYLQPLALQTYDGTFAVMKYDATAATDVIDATDEYDENTEYSTYDRVKVSDYGVIFAAGSDVPAGNHPLAASSVDENGVPYWIEADTVDELKPFDVSADTELTVAGKGLKISAEIRAKTYAWADNPSVNITPAYAFDQMSIMGVRYTGIAQKAVIYVQVYWTSLMDAIQQFAEDANKCSYYQAAIISDFSIDMTYRDRASFKMPSASEARARPANPALTGSDTFVADVDDDSISVDVYIEPVFGYLPPEEYSTPCDATAFGTPANGAVHVGMITVGTRQSIGRTLMGLDVGREVTRVAETNYLKRRTIKSAVETIALEALVDTPENHLKADYFFRKASETSNIIHGGVPAYDQRFAFGVLDSRSPVESSASNSISLEGRGVAFAATDPLITQTQNEGWS